MTAYTRVKFCCLHSSWSTSRGMSLVTPLRTWWIRDMLKERRSLARDPLQWTPPWSLKSEIFKLLDDSVKKKSNSVMDSIAAGMVSYTGAGRVSFPPPHTALKTHLDRKLGEKSRSRLLYSALPIAILLAETELGKDSQSLMALFLAAPLRAADAPTRTYPQILKEMESNLQQTNARHARVDASIAGASSG